MTLKPYCHYVRTFVRSTSKWLTTPCVHLCIRPRSDLHLSNAVNFKSKIPFKYSDYVVPLLCTPLWISYSSIATKARVTKQRITVVPNNRRVFLLRGRNTTKTVTLPMYLMYVVDFEITVKNELYVLLRVRICQLPLYKYLWFVNP